MISYISSLLNPASLKISSDCSPNLGWCLLTGRDFLLYLKAESGTSNFPSEGWLYSLKKPNVFNWGSCFKSSSLFTTPNGISAFLRTSTHSLLVFLVTLFLTKLYKVLISLDLALIEEKRSSSIRSSLPIIVKKLTQCWLV